MAGTTDTPTAYPAHTIDFAESFVPEDDVMKVARAMSAEVGLAPVSAGTGVVLRMLAAAGSARAVVEIGTGTGLSGLWLLRGMRDDGVLTTIDIEPEHQRMARRIFAEAGHAPGRTRLIAGRALDVLPRLADRAYDLVFVDGDRADYAACAQAAPRLLRSGGVLAVNGALGGGRVADPKARDPQTLALRELVLSLRDGEEWCPALLPVGDGLLCAVRR
jgi:predicted O-methyltransferase YrrM